MRAQINAHLNLRNLDVRVSHNARFTDQKCTPDVLCIVADCIINHTAFNNNLAFSSRNLWESEFAEESVSAVFHKPALDNAGAINEYNKFFQMPCKLLTYAGILNCNVVAGSNMFSVSNREILMFIASRERNALLFLQLYLRKVLIDSGLWDLFNTFFQTPNRQNFSSLKNGFIAFINTNTPVHGSFEPRRVFPKILNPLSFELNNLGTRGGRLSRTSITQDELMYNRINFRDINKDKILTRAEFEELNADQENHNYISYQINSAKNQIKNRHQLTSEVQDEFSIGEATQVHHIFAQSDFPQLAWILENLILLTPQQHLTRAHPHNNTHEISLPYQHICLNAKSHSIESSIIAEDDFYSKEQFVVVVNTGLNEELISNENDFDEIRANFAAHYH